MRRFSVLLLLVTCLAVPTSASALNVMTWNVGGGFDARNKKGEKAISTKAIAKVIFENHVDVIALQEVCRSQLNSIVAELDAIGQAFYHQDSGYRFRYAPTISPLNCSRPGSDTESDKSSFGDAIITAPQYPLASFEAAALPNRKRDRKTRKVVPLADEPRKAAAGTITVDGRAVRVWSVHVSPRCTCPTKKDPNYQLQFIHQKLLATLGHGLPDQLLLGDFNVRPEDAALGVFRKSPTLTDPDRTPTTWGKMPHKIDYVFRTASLRTVSTKVIDPPFHATRWDHKPLFAEISLG